MCASTDCEVVDPNAARRRLAALAKREELRVIAKNQPKAKAKAKAKAKGAASTKGKRKAKSKSHKDCHCFAYVR